MNSLIKQCSMCFEDKLMEDFYRRNASIDGRQICCKTCGYQVKNRNQKQRKAVNPSFKKSENLTTCLSNCLKNKQKKSKLENYLGCKLDFLYKWLAYTAGEDFDWSKYGSIYQVDHCIPKYFYSHENEQQIKQCWFWKNLRLITKEENMLKGNKIDLDIFFENASLAEDFLEESDSDDESSSDEDLINL